MKSTQAQRDYITSLLTKIGVENAHKGGGYRSPRDVARHCHSKKAASDVIGALKKI